MSPIRACARLALLAALVGAPLGRLSSQELGVYAGAGVSGIRDVRRPFGGGITGAWFFRDWLGVHADVGQYWVREHRIDLLCRPGNQEPICTTATLSSHSQFPLVDAAAMVRGHFRGSGVRVEAGIGPSWVNVTNEVRTEKDSIISPKLTSARAGAVVMAGILGKPRWRIPVTLEALYAYHMTAKFGACTNRPNDPLCDQNLNFHELRFSVLYRPKGAP